MLLTDGDEGDKIAAAQYTKSPSFLVLAFFGFILSDRDLTVAQADHQHLHSSESPYLSLLDM